MVDFRYCRSRRPPQKGGPRLERRAGRVLSAVSESPVLDDEHRLHGNDGTAAGQVPTSDGPTCATPGAATAAWLLPYIPPRLHRLGRCDRRTPPARSVRKARRTKCRLTTKCRLALPTAEYPVVPARARER